MKIKTIILLLVISSCKLMAQDTITKTEVETQDTTLEKVEVPPIFPGCEDNEGSELKICFIRAVHRIVYRYFDSSVSSVLGLTEGKVRIHVIFSINKDGLIEDVSAKAPHPALEDEALRVMEFLPKMTPGKVDGKPIRVTHNLPIVLYVEVDGDNEDINFEDLKDEDIPVFPGDDSLSMKLSKKYFKEKVSEHISKNVNQELSADLETEDRKKAVYACFYIDQEGKIVGVETYGAHRVLTTEIKRVIHLLPTMKPGKIDGKAVKVGYYFTFNFK